jgi:pimeloyl-ACP methyl ester carboxylesterase
VPTLVIDGSGHEELRDIADVLPYAEHVNIEVGHWVHQSDPETFVGAVRSFVNRVGL